MRLILRTLSALLTSALLVIGQVAPTAAPLVVAAAGLSQAAPASAALTPRKRLLLLHPAPVVSVGGTITTLNAADCNVAITLSGGNLIATKASGAAWVGCRSVGFASTGKYCVEATNVNAGVAVAVGLGNSSATLSDLVGNTADGLGSPSNDASVYQGGAGTGANTGSWNSAADRLQVCWDNGARLWWSKVNNGNWNNNAGADPVAGTLGTTMSPNIATGNVYVIVNVYSSVAPNQISIKFDVATFTNAAPSGYGSLTN